MISYLSKPNRTVLNSILHLKTSLNTITILIYDVDVVIFVLNLNFFTTTSNIKKLLN